jgi:hypothetical protein
VCWNCSARDEVVRSIPLPALLDQSPHKSNHARCRRAVEFSVDILSSTARLACSKQATSIHRLYSQCFQGDQLELSPQALAQRTVGNRNRGHAQSGGCSASAQTSPLASIPYVRLSPLQTKNSQMEVFHGALLRLLCSDRFKYEIPLNMYCFCKHCLCVFVYQSHVHNETTRQSWLSISPPRTWLN